MRLTYSEFMAAHEVDGKIIAARQYLFVALDVAKPGQASPVFPLDGSGRQWAIVDDEQVIARMRSISAEGRIYVAGKELRIDYDPATRPVLIVHDVR